MSLVQSFRHVALATAVTTFAAISVVGCGGGADPKTANVASSPMPEGEVWTGVYFHPVYGYLHMQEEGANVVARWKRTDQSHWGELSGTTTGNVFRYTWKEHKIGMVGASATTKGKGYFVYSVNKEGIGALDGEFGLNDSEVGSSWKNIKQVRMPVDLKSIGGDAEGVTPGQLGN
ncbi:MAG: hypothetical protein BGO98_34475 [Myxococcales bacterium 68-20]|nr:MAG: hypothetical protein BGO98_34475 [Myxococcales bacterium 68-20]